METLDLTTDIQPVPKFRANTCEMIESLKKNHCNNYFEAVRLACDDT